MPCFVYFSDNGINSRLLPTNCLSVFDHFIRACNFIKKETLAQVFSCEFCEISKNTFSYRAPLVTASANSLLWWSKWNNWPWCFFKLVRLLSRDLKLLRCLVLFLFPMLVLVQSFFKPMVVCNDKNKQIKSNKSKYQNIIYQITEHINKFTDKFTSLLIKWPP